MRAHFNHIKLRHIKKSDLDGIWHNFNEVVEEGLYLPVFFPVRSEYEKVSWYEVLKREREICIVAEDTRKKSPYNIVGQCEISNIEWDAATHVGNLGIIVARNYRDQGIGRKLIEFALEEAKKLNNKKKIILSCFSTNERAINLYKSIGFKEIGIRKNQFFIQNKFYDEVLMEIFLDDKLNY